VPPDRVVRAAVVARGLVPPDERSLRPMTVVAEVAASRELLGNLVQRELRGKYKRSALGWAWSMINPLALALTYWLVFSVVFKARLPPTAHGLNSYPLFLLTALLPFNFLSNGITGSMGSLVANSNLVKKVYFPREILVIAQVLSWDVSLFIEMGVLSIALLAVGNMVLPWLPLVVIAIAVQTLFVIGVGLALSVLNVYFRDVQHFVAILLQLWFYATPVIYDYNTQVKARVLAPTGHAHHFYNHEWVLWLYKFNPMVGFANTYHAFMYQLRFPVWTDVVWPVAASFAMLWIGLRVFRRLEPRLAEEL
jgi:ABC-type polysaccharide/polyol phosphate export permease